MTDETNQPAQLPTTAALSEGKARPSANSAKLSVTLDQSPERKRAINHRKLEEIGYLLWFPSGTDDDQKMVQVQRALELYEDLEPADAVEGMLAVQMIGSHHAALECLRRAALPDQSPELLEVNLKHANKMMALYAQQLATLDKHRGKGKQTVTVIRQVNMEPGSNAVMGNVETGAAPAVRRRTRPS